MEADPLGPPILGPEKARQSILNELARLLRDVEGPASALNRQKHSRVFEACAALKLGLLLWSQIPPETLRPKHPHHARGGFRDFGVDCASADLCHCAQAKWYAPKTYIKFTDASTFYTYSHGILGAKTLTIVHSEGVRVPSIVLDIPGITFVVLTNEELDQLAEEAKTRGRIIEPPPKCAPPRRLTRPPVMAPSGASAKPSAPPAAPKIAPIAAPPRSIVGSILWAIFGIAFSGTKEPKEPKSNK